MKVSVNDYYSSPAMGKVLIYTVIEGWRRNQVSVPVFFFLGGGGGELTRPKGT